MLPFFALCSIANQRSMCFSLTNSASAGLCSILFLAALQFSHESQYSYEKKQLNLELTLTCELHKAAHLLRNGIAEVSLEAGYH